MKPHNSTSNVNGEIEQEISRTSGVKKRPETASTVSEGSSSVSDPLPGSARNDARSFIDRLAQVLLFGAFIFSCLLLFEGVVKMGGFLVLTQNPVFILKNIYVQVALVAFMICLISVMILWSRHFHADLFMATFLASVFLHLIFITMMEYEDMQVRILYRVPSESENQLDPPLNLPEYHWDPQTSLDRFKNFQDKINTADFSMPEDELAPVPQTTPDFTAELVQDDSRKLEAEREIKVDVSSVPPQDNIQGAVPTENLSEVSASEIPVLERDMTSRRLSVPESVANRITEPIEIPQGRVLSGKAAQPEAITETIPERELVQPQDKKISPNFIQPYGEVAVAGKAWAMLRMPDAKILSGTGEIIAPSAPAYIPRVTVTDTLSPGSISKITPEVSIPQGGRTTGVRGSSVPDTDFSRQELSGLKNQSPAAVTYVPREADTRFIQRKNASDDIILKFSDVPTPEMGGHSLLAELPAVPESHPSEDEFGREPFQIGAIREERTRNQDHLTSVLNFKPDPQDAYRQRARSEHRKMIERAGGDPETESVVERGLAFLDYTQFPDGHWSFNRISPNLESSAADAALGQISADTGATGLGLLAFLGAGYTHLDGDYKTPVKRALEWLLENQNADGSLFRSDTDWDRTPRIYSHGIATIALCEAYGMTRDPQLREPAQKAINYIVKAQTKKLGSWRYTPGPDGKWRGEGDTSVAGWQVMALISAKMAGLSVPQDTLNNVHKWLDLAAVQDGTRFCYTLVPNPVTEEHKQWTSPSYAMTAEALLMQLYLQKSSRNEKFQDAVNWIALKPAEMNSDVVRDTYYWYYATQVMFHLQGERWKQWNEKITPLLMKTQETDGPFTGSWHPVKPVPDKWGAHAGRHYITAMHLLILEVYYRHLPLIKNISGPQE